jgi:hypothetical protein
MIAVEELLAISVIALSASTRVAIRDQTALR